MTFSLILDEGSPLPFVSHQARHLATSRPKSRPGSLDKCLDSLRKRKADILLAVVLFHRFFGDHIKSGF